MRCKKLKEYLDREEVEYVTIAHSPAFTAQKIAASAHIRGQELAKTVMIRLDGSLAMVVLPASFRVDLTMLRDITLAKDVELAAEAEFGQLFPDCEVGAMPPFGNLYGMDVYVASSLAEDEFIAFNGGSHIELVKMRYVDYARLVNPIMVDISVPMH